MSSSIDTELTLLRSRIAVLEEAKRVPPPPKVTAGELLATRKHQAENDRSRKNESPIATACRFMRCSEVELLESVVESLNRIHARLDALELSASTS